METQLTEKTFENLMNPDAWMFPLRVALNAEGFFEIWTRYDNRLGSRNNFALATGIQNQELAEWMCAALNQARLENQHSEDREPPCPTCRGSGHVNPLTAPKGFLCIGTTECPDCEGSGEMN